MIGVIALLMIIMWLLFFFSVYTEEPYFIFISGCGMILVSVYTMVNGIEGVNNLVTRGISLIQIGVGFLALTAPVFSEGE